MALTGEAALLVTNDVAAEAEAAFDQWYIDEHLPERAAVPGFRRGRRWRALGHGQRDLTLYELATLETMRSAAYLARTAAPTPATRAMMGNFLGMSRSVCRIRDATGAGDGGAAAFLPLPRAHGAGLATALADARGAAGVLSVAWLDCDEAASAGDSVESRLRRVPDSTIELAAWIEATGPEEAGVAARRVAAALGFDKPAGLYRLVAAMALR